MPTTQETIDATGITNVLFDRGTLVHLYVGRWTGNKKLRETDLLLTEVDSDAIYLGHKRLLPTGANAVLQSLETQARSFLASRSIPFPIGNARFVYYRTLTELLTRLRSIKADFDAAVVALLNNYSALKIQQLDLLDRQAHALVEEKLRAITDTDACARKRVELNEWLEEQRRLNRSYYPSLSELGSKFVFEWHMFKVSPLEGVEQMSSLEQQDLLDAQRRIQEDLQRWVRDVSTEMHKSLGEAAANARRMLGENGKLNPKNLKPLFDAFDSFKAINFTGAGDVQVTLDQIRARYQATDQTGSTDYQTTANNVNGNPEELSQLLSTIANLAIDQVAEKAGVQAIRSVGEFRRFVEV